MPARGRAGRQTKKQGRNSRQNKPKQKRQIPPSCGQVCANSVSPGGVEQNLASLANEDDARGVADLVSPAQRLGCDPAGTIDEEPCLESLKSGEAARRCDEKRCVEEMTAQIQKRLQYNSQKRARANSVPPQPDSSDDSTGKPEIKSLKNSVDEISLERRGTERLAKRARPKSEASSSHSNTSKRSRHSNSPVCQQQDRSDENPEGDAAVRTSATGCDDVSRDVPWTDAADAEPKEEFAAEQTGAANDCLSVMEPLAPDFPGHTNGMVSLELDGVSSEVLIEHRGYCRREQFLISLEKSGELTSKYVQNDGTPQHLVWLTGVKTAIMNQLPNMPREYITRVVMDRRHRSIALIQNKEGVQADFVMGAAVYRPFHKLKFGELVFFAIDGVQQVKGFGTHLMNCLKQFARDNDGLTHLLTYADNKATGFFAKNGFSRRITLTKEQYTGYIKDYEYAVPMECVLLHQIPYTQIPNMIKNQRRLLLNRLKQYSKSHVKRPGLDIFKSPDHELLPVNKIPGVSEAKGFTSRDPSNSLKLIIDNKVVDANPERLEDFMDLVLREVKKRGESWPFLEPVNPADVPDYYTIISNPIDISTIEARLKRKNYYITLDIFQADWKRMFDNCRFYNAESTVYYKLAEKLDKFITKFVSTRVVRGFLG
ncbi:hypothetical protein BSKO_05406 [Bryopsis sp. KO-2023]|nr:hypothetical protein BSKO_05406 [Bryopsis sp. KO-2023]